MKYKTVDLDMKFNVPWSFLSEGVAHFFTPLYHFLYKDHHKKCRLTKVEQFSKCSFQEICNEYLTASS